MTISENICINSTLGDIVMMKYFCTATWKEKCCNILACIDKNKTFIILVLAWFICVMHPLLHTGVILNDEVQALFERQNGYFALLERNVGCELAQGRPLRIMAAFNSSLSFLSSNMVINRGIQIFILGITAVSLAAFVKKLFLNSFISCMTAILFLVCMPITFEHAVPNAFVGLVCIPLICLCWSLYFWIEYIKSHSKKTLILSMFFWILALCGYEFVVMYTPVFIFIYLYICGIGKKWYSIVHSNMLPIVIGAIYIVCTLIIQSLCGVGYSGVKIQFESVSSSWAIIKTIVYSSIPGYFITNPKYLYLCSVYSDDNFAKAVMQIFDEHTLLDCGRLLNLLIREVVSIDVIIMVLLTILLIMFITSHTRCEKFSNRKQILSVVVFGLYMIFPIIPNSITSLYQGHVTYENFTSLPVSTFVFASECVLISILIQRFRDINKWIKYSFCIGGLIIVFIIQYMNVMFASVHASNYHRVVTIERLFKTEIFKNMNGSVIYSPDILVRKNALELGDNYWNEIAKKEGLNFNVLKKGDSNVKLFYVDDKYFCIVDHDKKMLISEKPIKDNVVFKIDDDHYIMVKVGNPSADNGLYVYSVY